jgi:hypothetical protein
MADDIFDVEGAWRIKINSMEIEFNKLRTKFYNDVNRYYRRSVYSKYNDELYLSEQLVELKNLRNKIIAYKEKAMGGTTVDDKNQES